MNNPRINGEKKRCAKMKADWIKDPIIILAKYKKLILEEPDKMDFNEGFFYPDFEHYSNVIHKRYSKK
jgi:hypothetical protein